MLAGSVLLNAYIKNTFKTWKYFALHLTMLTHVLRQKAFFFHSGQNASWKCNTPKLVTVYFAIVLQMWHWHLLTILEATAYGYHSVESTLSHVLYNCLNMCLNIVILAQWDVNWSDRLGPYKNSENIGFLLFMPFPLSYTSILLNKRHGKGRKLLLREVTAYGKSKDRQGNEIVTHPYSEETTSCGAPYLPNQMSINCTCMAKAGWQLLPSTIKKHTLSYGKFTLCQMLKWKSLYSIFEHV